MHDIYLVERGHISNKYFCECGFQFWNNHNEPVICPKCECKKEEVVLPYKYFATIHEGEVIHTSTHLKMIYYISDIMSKIHDVKEITFREIDEIQHGQYSIEIQEKNALHLMKKLKNLFENL